MRILHTEASAGWGGQELRILAEMQGMRARGHVLELAAPAEARISREARALGFIVHSLPIARKSLRGLLAMRTLLRRERFDVVNSHSSTDTWLTALACQTLREAPPLVRTRHISAPLRKNAATRWLYTRATNSIVTTGEKLRRDLIEVNGFTRVPIRSVPTGIDPKRFQPRDARAARAELGLPERFTIGIVATLRSWKGHRFLIEAFSNLPGEPQLAIVGDGPQRANLESLVAAKALTNRVRFVGHDSRPERWLQALDLFVLPSYANEGVPQALMQAMMCGVPCVTTDVGAIGEIAVHGRTAWIVPPQDAGALGEALARLMADATQRAALGEAARSFALAHCTFEEMCRAMEEVFREAMRGEQSS